MNIFKNCILIILFSGGLCPCIYAQEVQENTEVAPGESVFGKTNYTEYILGTLPIVIASPHGGRMHPEKIPDRDENTCGKKVVTVTDKNTQELVRAIENAIWKLTGQHPHVILSLLSRKKMDPNRNMKEGACGNALAEDTWHDYQDFIDSAEQKVLRQYGRGIFIEIHGHGHPIQRNELGYLFKGKELEVSDSVLNLPDNIAKSSIRYLAANNAQKLTHAELLRGDESFGTLLSNEGYPCVPSKQDPAPKPGESYFEGGYNTRVWTSAEGGHIDGFQIETNYKNVRDNTVNIQYFSEAFAKSLLAYIKLHIFPNADFKTTNK